MPQPKPLHFHSRVAVTVWIHGRHGSEKVVEVELDDIFTAIQLPQVGMALQRGVYEALQQAMKEVLEGESNERQNHLDSSQGPDNDG